MAKVTITITPLGYASVDVDGVQGPACKELTAAVERLLGTTVSTTRKAEFEQLSGESAQAELGQF